MNRSEILKGLQARPAISVLIVGAGINGIGTFRDYVATAEWMRLSCHEFKNNAVRLALFVLAYNLGNFLRRLALPPAAL